MWDKPTIVAAIFSFLQERGAPVTEYELIQHLSGAGHFAAFEGDSFSMRLFRQHFVTRHCLYSLQQNLTFGWHLSLDALQIYLQPTESGLSVGRELGVADVELRNFYLDLTHLEEADEDSVAELLNRFWTRFHAWQSGAEAYRVLELQPGASPEEVERAYRRAAQKAHPDRGGSAEVFSRLREAYETLKKL